MIFEFEYGSLELELGLRRLVGVKRAIMVVDTGVVGVVGVGVIVENEETADGSFGGN